MYVKTLAFSNIWNPMVKWRSELWFILVLGLYSTRLFQHGVWYAWLLWTVGFRQQGHVQSWNSGLRLCQEKSLIEEQCYHWWSNECPLFVVETHGLNHTQPNFLAVNASKMLVEFAEGQTFRWIISVKRSSPVLCSMPLVAELRFSTSDIFPWA